MCKDISNDVTLAAHILPYVPYGGTAVNWNIGWGVRAKVVFLRTDPVFLRVEFWDRNDAILPAPWTLFTLRVQSLWPAEPCPRMLQSQSLANGIARVLCLSTVHFLGFDMLWRGVLQCGSLGAWKVQKHKCTNTARTWSIIYGHNPYNHWESSWQSI